MKEDAYISSTFSVMNRTAGGTKSQLLTGGYSSQIGATKILKVYPGDKVKAEVYAKYWNTTGVSGEILDFAAALTGAFGVSSVSTGEMLNAYQGLNTFGAFTAAGDKDDDDASPKGCITIMVFDKDRNLLDAAWDQLDADYNQDGYVNNDPFDHLEKEIDISQEGYVYIYLSNENATQVDIHFDDLKVTHTKSNVIQYNEYYPFGLQTSNSWVREDHSNNYLYNAGSEKNKTTGNYEMLFREYDPALGRMNAIDPMACKYSSLTPYNYAFNDPVIFNDPSGADPIDDMHERMGIPRRGYSNLMGNYQLEMDGGGGGPIVPGYGNHWSDQFSGGYSSGYNLTIDLNTLQDGVYFFGFTRGIISSFGTISGDMLSGMLSDMSLRLLRQILGLDAWTPSTHITLLQSNFGNFAQQLSDGTKVIPYTNQSYAPSITRLVTGVDNSWRTPWFFTDGFLHPELMNASTDIRSFSGATNIAGTFLATTERSLTLHSKFVQGTYYTSAATEQAKLVAGAGLVERAGRYVGLAGSVAGGLEGAFDGNGFTLGDGVKFGIGLATAYGGTWGAAYGVLDFAVGIWSGASITERIGAGIDYSNGASKLPK